MYLSLYHVFTSTILISDNHMIVRVCHKPTAWAFYWFICWWRASELEIRELQYKETRHRTKEPKFFFQSVYEVLSIGFLILWQLKIPLVKNGLMLVLKMRHGLERLNLWTVITCLGLPTVLLSHNFFILSFLLCRCRNPLHCFSFC